MVTNTRLAPLVVTMRTAACTMALIALLYIAASVGRVEGRVWPVVGQITQHEPDAIKQVSSISFQQVVGGLTIRHTAVQHEGETFADFMDRAWAEWNAVLTRAQNG